MKLKNLTVRGFGQNDVIFDFEQINATLTVAIGDYEKLFVESLFPAMFGLDAEKKAAVELGGTYYLEFEDKEKHYVVERNYTKKTESIKVTCGEKEIDADVYYAILANAIKRDPQLFHRLGFVSGDIVGELANEGLVHYLAAIDNVEQRIEDSYEEHKEQLSALEEKLVHLDNFNDDATAGGRNALLELDKDIATLEASVDIISEEIALEAAREEREALAINTAEKFIELEEIESEMDVIYDIVTKSRKAKAILDMEASVVSASDLRPDFINNDGDVAVINAKVENLNQQIVRFAEEQRKAEGEVIYYAEKLQEIRGDVHGLVEVTASGATGEVESEVSEYYEEFKNAKASYAERLKAVELERAALYEHISELEDRRNKINYPVAYRKAVIDAVTLEDRMVKLAQIVEKEEAIIKDVEDDVNKKQAELEKLSQKAIDLEKAGAELLHQIVGDYDTKEERFNAENVLRNKLYSNHIIVADQLAEVKAIDEKIKKLEEGQQDFIEKRAKLNDAKVDVELHKAKLNKRLKQMETKYNERIAENLYAQQIEALSYGDRCPICDGFVIKKNAKLRFMKMDDILADMQAIKDAIEEDDAKIARVLLKLGAYMSATASGEAYINSLKDTKAKKLEMVMSLCKECEVKDAAELTEKLRESIASQQKANENLDFYHDLEGRLASVLEAKSRVQFQIKKMVEIDLSRHQKLLDETKASIREAVDEYRPVMKILGEGKGKDVLPQLMVVDKELETIALDMESARKRLAATDKEKEDITKTLAVFEGRDLPIGDNNENVNVAGLGAKVIARRLKAMTDEIKKFEDAYENAKVRFVAAKRVVDNYSQEKYALEKQLIQHNAVERAMGGGEKVSKLQEDINLKLKEMGVATTAELKEFVFENEIENALEMIVNEYRGELYTVRNAVEQALEVISEEVVDVTELKEQRSAVKDAISDLYQERATLKIALEMAEKNDRVKEETERELKKTKANIRELEAIKSLIVDGKLDDIALFARLISVASANAYGMSKGAISLDLTAQGIQVVDNLHNSVIVAENALTKYQSTVRKLALFEAIADAFDAILNSDTDVYFVLDDADISAEFAELAVNFSRNRNLTLVADDSVRNALVEVL